MSKVYVFALSLAWLGALPAWAEDTDASFSGDRDGHEMRDVIPKHEIPEAPILTVKQALKGFSVQPGFVVEPVVVEPNVFNPVAMSFDAKGRMWVAEMTTYMPDVHGNGELKPEGNIVVLEDADGDGAVDKRTIFLSDIILPRTISQVKGGIFYADQNSLYFTEVLERDGELTPGTREVVDADYAEGGNVEHKPNTMLYGMDGWYYNAKSNRKYQILALAAKLPLGSEEIYRNRYWKLVRAITDYRGQWGLSMDDYGRLYHNGNSSPIHGEYLLPGSLLKNPGFWPNMPAHSIGDIYVYPSRMNPGVNRGYMDGMLVADGPNRGKLVGFTAASGSLVYRGSNFPQKFYGMGLTPEPAANLISARYIVEGEGELTGKPVYPQQELLTSQDERFRPVNLYNAPDGTVYLLDMYHGILQHKDFLTSYLASQIKDRELDKNNNTMGRIYRLRWQENAAAKVPDLNGLTNADLLPLLAHPNAWQRDTARRLLIERGAQSSAPDIRSLIKQSKNPVAIINGLWTLYGLGQVDLATVKAFIPDSNDQVAMAAAAVGEVLPEKDHKAYHGLLMQLAQSGYPRALQAAISVSAIEGGTDVSKFVLETYLDKPYIREAVISGLGRDANEFIARINGDYPDADVMYALNNLGKKRQDATNFEQLSETGKALYSIGKKLYNGRTACAGCHGEHGNGVPGLGPTFWDSQWLNNKETLAKVLLHGLSGSIWVGPHYWNTQAVMPGFAARADISDKDLAAVATYIRNSWGNTLDSEGAYTEEEFAKIRAKTAGRATPYKAENFE
ncbi:PVC-type heme-binding CxxCH protein [Gilvimarinus polysaccharolyticus]|uniref:PVC-type heme-binding CxxCH protein n=1 Tax=Gilvimarinus polysaccharolyticus TaxID=863921 RepID=UPI000673735C|nr:PVC-type heme-binding CxxCH protein [Gilvimarinus polysaccharolyticus]